MARTEHLQRLVATVKILEECACEGQRLGEISSHQGVVGVLRHEPFLDWQARVFQLNQGLGGAEQGDSGSYRAKCARRRPSCGNRYSWAIRPPTARGSPAPGVRLRVPRAAGSANRGTRLRPRAIQPVELEPRRFEDVRRPTDRGWPEPARTIAGPPPWRPATRREYAVCL